MKEMNIPVGVSDFEEIRKNGYYYIDKSGLIGELLSRTGTKVSGIKEGFRITIIQLLGCCGRWKNGGSL